MTASALRAHRGVVEATVSTSGFRMPANVVTGPSQPSTNANAEVAESRKLRGADAETS